MSYLAVSEAQARILAHVSPGDSEWVPLHDSLNRVLAEDVKANRNHPPYDVSAMDGYAVRFDDIARATRDAPVLLTMVEDIRASQMPRVKVLQGRTSRIMTGAPTPDGIDTVIRVENTEEDGNRVSILAPPERGREYQAHG